MIFIEELMNLQKEELEQFSANLSKIDIGEMLSLLKEKDDKLRYNTFLIMQSRSKINSDVFEYWNEFIDMLYSSNSYHRSIGIMLIAENAKWDKEGKFIEIMDLYLSYCDDEKSVTVRQCIQSMCKIIPFYPQTWDKIVDKLISIDLGMRKETQRKLLLTDIITVLIDIEKQKHNLKIEQYISNAMTGEILDRKTKLQFEKLMKKKS